MNDLKIFRPTDTANYDTADYLGQDIPIFNR